MTNEVTVVEAQALSVPDEAKNFIISTNEQFSEADSILFRWKKIEAEIHAAFDPLVETAHNAHKEAVAQRKKYLDPIEQGRAILKPKMIAWSKEQERIRLEAERKAQEEARKKAEEERLAAAVKAEKSGDSVQAEILVSTPVEVKPVTVAKTVPKTDTRFRTVWYAEVTDIKALCAAVAEGKQPVTLVQANTTELNRMASAMKEGLNIPGVVASSKTV